MASGDITGDIIYRDRATKALNDAGNASEKTGKKFGGLGKTAGLVGAAAGLMAVKFGKDSVAAFAESEKSQAALTLAYQKFPKTADVSIESLRGLNSELAKKTTFDDDAFASGQAVLAQFDLTGKQIQNLTPLMADLAEKTGQDLPGAATLLGKAYQGNTKALKTLGINYKATGNKAKDQAAVTELLRQKVGGAAEAMGNTAAGKAEILKNQYGELQEMAGSKLVPALTKLAAVGLKVVDFISRNQKVIVPLVAVLGGLAATVWVVNKAVKAYTAVQAALNVVMALNPIGLVVIALVALGAGLVIAYKKSETFRAVVKGAMDAVKAAVVGMKNGVVAAFGVLKSIFLNFTGPGLLIKHWDTIVSTIKGLPKRITSAASGMWDGIKNAFRSAINWIIDKWNGLDFTIGGGSVFGKNLPSVTLGTPNIPRLAKGGDITRAGRALVGDAGPEILDLPRGARVTPLGRGSAGGVHITVNGFVGNEMQLAKEIRRVLLRLKDDGGLNLGLA